MVQGRGGAGTPPQPAWIPDGIRLMALDYRAYVRMSARHAVAQLGNRVNSANRGVWQGWRIVVIAIACTPIRFLRGDPGGASCICWSEVDSVGQALAVVGGV